MNAAAAAALGDMPMLLAGCRLAGCAFGVLGVKDGDSTLNDFFGLQGIVNPLKVSMQNGVLTH